MRLRVKPKYLTLLGIATVAGIGIWFGLQWASKPVEESVTASAPAPTPVAATPDQAVTTKFFTTAVPATYRVQISSHVNNADLVQVFANKKTASDEQIGITTNLLPSDGLAGVADYNYRRSKPGDYSVLPSADLQANSTLFQSRTGAAELTLFTTYGPRYASVAITGGKQSEQITRLQALCHTWKWL
ncbi:MAG TPA: hypothetical protein VMY99_01980 [Nevskiaceae bacterium]|nr:hypothetical protein [Nevskiaceae bacterium]